MKIDHIHIENFRSLRTVDIYPNDLCIFVGENNAGKSNILQALNLVLGESWPTVKSLSENDFFDNNMNIVIPKNLYINYANVTIGERNEIL